MAIDYYLTCISPFTYLGHRLICEVAEKHRVEINFKPVNLFRIWEVSGARPPAERPPVRQRMRLVELQRLAHFRKLPINVQPKYWPVDGSLADRVAVALIENGHDPRYFIGKVLAGLWAHDDNIADEAVLASYLSQCGLDPKPALADAQEDWTQAIRDNNANEAIAADAVGVPAYIYQGETFWGQDRIEHLDHMLSLGREPFHASAPR